MWWSLGSLSNDDHDVNENGKKALGLYCQNNNFARASRFVEDGNTKQQLSFSFPELWYSPLELKSKNFANIWRIERDGISAIKFQAARIHFLSDVFVAVAIVVA